MDSKTIIKNVLLLKDAFEESNKEYQRTKKTLTLEELLLLINKLYMFADKYLNKIIPADELTIKNTDKKISIYDGTDSEP